MLQTKAIRPSVREKKRYIVYEITSDSKINMQKLQKTLVDELQRLLGAIMSGQAGILPVTFDDTTNRGIIRVNHMAVDHIKACFVMIAKLQNQPVQIQSVHVSGILKISKTHLQNNSEERK